MCVRWVSQQHRSTHQRALITISSTIIWPVFHFRFFLFFFIIIIYQPDNESLWFFPSIITCTHPFTINNYYRGILAAIRFVRWSVFCFDFLFWWNSYKVQTFRKCYDCSIPFVQLNGIINLWKKGNTVTNRV